MQSFNKDETKGKKTKKLTSLNSMKQLKLPNATQRHKLALNLVVVLYFSWWHKENKILWQRENKE